MQALGCGFWRGSLSIRDSRSEPPGRYGPLDADIERSSAERTYFLDDDHPRDECGVFGIYDRDSDVARAAFFGLHALQHRGQESAGIATSDGETIRVHADLGLVTQVFREEDMQGLTGHIAIGHNRYSTKGAPRRYNAQPYIIKGPNIEFAFGHNGNVINAMELRQELDQFGLEVAPEVHLLRRLVIGFGVIGPLALFAGLSHLSDEVAQVEQYVRGVPLIEHVIDLDTFEETEFEMFAFPLKLYKIEGAPARVVARVG